VGRGGRIKIGFALTLLCASLASSCQAQTLADINLNLDKPVTVKKAAVLCEKPGDIVATTPSGQPLFRGPGIVRFGRKRRGGILLAFITPFRLNLTALKHLILSRVIFYLLQSKYIPSIEQRLHLDSMQTLALGKP